MFKINTKRLTLMEGDGLKGCGDGQRKRIIFSEQLTGSSLLGGSKRTLEPAVVGSYEKPISRINYPYTSEQRLMHIHARFTFTKLSHFMEARPCFSFSEVLSN